MKWITDMYKPRCKNKLDERIISQHIEKSPVRNLVSYRIPKLPYLTFPGHTQDTHSILSSEYEKVVKEFKKHQQQYYNNTTVSYTYVNTSRNEFGNKLLGLLVH